MKGFYYLQDIITILEAEQMTYKILLILKKKLLSKVISLLIYL